jgi:hypothetical protein
MGRLVETGRSGLGRVSQSWAAGNYGYRAPANRGVGGRPRVCELRRASLSRSSAVWWLAPPAMRVVRISDVTVSNLTNGQLPLAASSCGWTSHPRLGWIVVP